MDNAEIRELKNLIRSKVKDMTKDQLRQILRDNEDKMHLLERRLWVQAVIEAVHGKSFSRLMAEDAMAKLKEKEAK